MTMLWMLLTLPLAAATIPADCSSSYKNAITDLKSVKDAKEETIDLGKKIVGNQISTASYTPASLAGLPSDVGCDANDKKAYVFKLKLNVGDTATFVVYTDKNSGSGSWQIRQSTGENDICPQEKFFVSETRCFSRQHSATLAGHSDPRIFTIFLQPAQNEPMNLWWVYTPKGATTKKPTTAAPDKSNESCGDLLQDCRHICTKPPKNCVVMTSKGFYETCGCPEEKTTAGGGSGYVYVGGSWAQSTGIKRVTYTGANAKTTVGGGSENAKMTTVGAGSGNAEMTTGAGSDNAKMTTGAGSDNDQTTVGGGSENAKMTTVGFGSQDVDERKVVDEDTGCVFETKAVVYALAIFSTALLG